MLPLPPFISLCLFTMLSEFVTCKSNQPSLCLQVKVTVFSPWQTPLSTTLSTMRFSCATLSRPSSLTASHPIMARLPRAPSSTPIATLHPPGSAISGAAAAQEVRTCSASSPTTIWHTLSTPGFPASQLSCRKWRMTTVRRHCWTTSSMSSGHWMGGC